MEQTFESVQHEISKHDVEAHIASGDLVRIYQVARPILLLISTFRLIPKKWREIVTALVTLLDSKTASANDEDA